MEFVYFLPALDQHCISSFLGKWCCFCPTTVEKLSSDSVDDSDDDDDDDEEDNEDEDEDGYCCCLLPKKKQHVPIVS